MYAEHRSWDCWPNATISSHESVITTSSTMYMSVDASALSQGLRTGFWRGLYVRGFHRSNNLLDFEPKTLCSMSV